MSKHRKIEHKVFTHSDYEEEQAYLRKMHNRGWALKAFHFPAVYVFDKCAPRDVVYQLDCNIDRKGEPQVYIQMFTDCGWEYICDFNDWSYFRKAADEIDPSEEFYGNPEAKQAFIQRVFRQKLVPLLVIFPLLIIPQLCIQYHTVFSGEGRPINGFFLFFFLVMAGVYLHMFMKMALKYYKTRK